MAIPNLNDPFKRRGLTALIGPTNTGKTHFAIERMLGHASGMTGLPLRLLAREVYQRVVERVGAESVALITGEEKIRPRRPRYTIATVEAMPRDLDVAFVAVDEIQLAADADRGHVFTDALINRRGSEETILIGSSTIRPLIERLLPGANIVSRPRLSKLTFAGERKLTRLPPRSVVVAFSADEVYAIAELLRRERGGAAVVLGALSPRTRNAQVALFQSGEVDVLVATDAIGMGLNLDVDHVAFAGDRKFDGRDHRRLSPAEMGQIAGRAGRHLRDGTFGSTGRCPPLDQEMVEALEEHRFDPVQLINWRNPDIDLASLSALQASLAVSPTVPGLVRARTAVDEATLDLIARRPSMARFAGSRVAVERLWDVCKLPDYRKVAPHVHADLVESLFQPLMQKGTIPADWFARELSACDRTDGDIATLSARIAEVRTWSYCANRNDWLDHPAHWQNVARALEDKLSDALHEKLAQRFIDRRTAVLMRRLRENAMLEAEITETGDVLVESQHLGRLDGFRFTPDTKAEGPEAKALKAAAARALASEIEARARRLAEAADNAFVLSLDGTIRWVGAPVARLQAGDKFLEPRLLLLADDQLAGGAYEAVEQRLTLWLTAHVDKLLGPLKALEKGDALTGAARGIGYQIAENFGVLDRSKVAEVVKNLDQQARSELRSLGVRFGAHHLYTSALMKPAPRALAAQLYALRHEPEATGVADVSHLASSGRTSIPNDPAISRDLYRVAGFRVCGERAVRVDILERLADLIRPALAWRAGAPGEMPAGAYTGGGFVVTGAMTSLVGCAGEDFASILTSLGYRREMKPAPVAAEAPPVAPVATEGEAPAAAETPIDAGELPDETPQVEPAATEGAPAEETAAEPAPPDATQDTPVEPALVAVWRPGRPEGDRQRRRERDEPRRNHRRDRPREAGDRPAAATADAAPRQEGPRQEGPRQEARGDRPPRPERREGPRRDGERAESRPPRPDRPERRDDRKPQERADKRPFRDRPRQDRDRGAGKGPERERVWQDKPRTDKGIDPDSPFAKLLALKAKLDGKP